MARLSRIELAIGPIILYLNAPPWETIVPVEDSASLVLMVSLLKHPCPAQQQYMNLDVERCVLSGYARRSPVYSGLTSAGFVDRFLNCGAEQSDP